MTIQTNSQNTYAAIGIREDLTDLVALIDPQETPFISNIGLGKPAKSTKHEWQVQALAAASKTNYQLEGDDNVSAAAATARERLFNYCAISKKVGSVTGTMAHADVAGISNELDNQKMLKAVELRRDMEVILLDNNAYEAGSTSSARECAGLATYITNVDPSGFSNFSAGNGTGSLAWSLATATSRALGLTIMNAALVEAHKDGGKPNMLMFSPRNKINFSQVTFATGTGAVQTRYNLNGVRPAALIGAVDTWLSDFGSLDVMSNVQMASDSGTTNGEDDTILMIDTNHVGVSYYRPMFTEDLAKTGDATKFEVLAEYTLEVDAPKAHAACFAIT